VISPAEAQSSRDLPVSLLTPPLVVPAPLDDVEAGMAMCWYWSAEESWIMSLRKLTVDRGRSDRVRGSLSHSCHALGISTFQFGLSRGKRKVEQLPCCYCANRSRWLRAPSACIWKESPVGNRYPVSTE